MGTITTPELNLIKPDLQEIIKNNWDTQHETNVDKIDAVGSDLEYSVGGWTYIGHNNAGERNVGTVNIDVTADGKFPAGTFSMLRLYMRYDLNSAGEFVSLRLNGDTSGSNYFSGRTQYDAAGNFVDAGYSNPLSRFVIGVGGTISTNNLICTLYNTHQNDLTSFRGTAVRQSDSATAHWIMFAHGRRATNIGPITELNLTVFGDQFVYMVWWLEGFKVP